MDTWQKLKVGLLLIPTCFCAFSNAQSVTNPLFAGFYPDPSICKAGNDYYIVNSSFAYYPGLPVFHSRDLLNWEQLGYALSRPEQLDLDGAGVSRGLFAASISYHKGTFYIVCTLIDKLGNFVITAKDPKGPWTNPVPVKVEGIDPSLFFDADGRSWLLYNSIPPGNKPMYEGHRTIRIIEFDAEKLAVKGKEMILVNGGTDITKKPVWIEGPHLIQKEGWYYLVCAEGGTGYQHSEVVFRSRSLEEAFIAYEGNPILTQRDLDPSRAHPITTTGHADFVQDQTGKWWAVFLGCRPYEGDFYNTGRETFIAPVEWINGWPVINPGKNEVQYQYPINAVRNKHLERFNGNYHFKDEFNSKELNIRYSFLRTVRDKWFRVDAGKGRLQLQLRKETCSGNANPSFIGFRQAHLKGYAATAMHFNTRNQYEKAGLLIFQGEENYYFLCKSVEEGRPVIQLYKGSGDKKNPGAEKIVSLPVKVKNKKNIYLKIEADRNFYAFYYAVKKGKWRLLKDKVDGYFLSTKTAGGFVGAMYALYATSDGNVSNAIAEFDWFDYMNQDDVYE